VNKKVRAGSTTFFIDGGSRGNPGPAGYGVAVKNAGDETIATLSKFLGIQTNNYAEYSALLAALDYATRHHLAHIRVFSDSELLVRQMTGKYKVKSPDLRPLFEQARETALQIPRFEIEHVRRELNREADALANEAMDRTGSGVAAPQTFHFEAIVENGLIKPLSKVKLPDKKIVECSLRIKN
jgi:ribonuclease HI